MKFTLSSQAETAFRQLWDYYNEQSGPDLADRIFAEIRDSIDQIIENPQLGHFRTDLTDRPFRFYRVYSIFLIYDPASSPLYIARVYHAAQDIRARMKAEND